MNCIHCKEDITNNDDSIYIRFHRDNKTIEARACLEPDCVHMFFDYVGTQIMGVLMFEMSQKIRSVILDGNESGSRSEG